MTAPGLSQFLVPSSEPQYAGEDENAYDNDGYYYDEGIDRAILRAKTGHVLYPPKVTNRINKSFYMSIFLIGTHDPD